MITIREYKPTDYAACVGIFENNCPAFFDPSEKDLLENWLHWRGKDELAYESSEAEFFYVLESNRVVLACGGFYTKKEELSAVLVWGMVDLPLHKNGYGTQLLRYRLEKIKELYPSHHVVLDTSQHTFSFFEKLGFSVTSVTHDGYGPELHRYDMKLSGAVIGRV